MAKGKDGKFVAEYLTLDEAARALNAPPRQIVRILQEANVEIVNIGVKNYDVPYRVAVKDVEKLAKKRSDDAAKSNSKKKKVTSGKTTNKR